MDDDVCRKMLLEKNVTKAMSMSLHCHGLASVVLRHKFHFIYGPWIHTKAKRGTRLAGRVEWRGASLLSRVRERKNHVGLLFRRKSLFSWTPNSRTRSLTPSAFSFLFSGRVE